ncbi:MAG: hypothetical protein M9950_11950 [Thermomicrobiales bacterium]|nr:hypothetical protein [Thermomicrobiales bacterium]
MTESTESTIDDLEITCPSCGQDLSNDVDFLTWRVCGHCGRHFSMPAIERVNAILDAGTFRPLREAPVQPERADDVQASALDRLASARERSVVQEAIVVGTGEIGGTAVIVIGLDDHLVGSQIGALGAEKIILALDHALTRRLPVIGIIAGGASVIHTGPLANVQGARIASMAAQVQAMGIPMIGILTHPTSAAVFAAFGSVFDLIFAEPGTSVGVVWSPDRPIDAILHAIPESDLLENGWIDGVMPRSEQHDRLANIIAIVARTDVKPANEAHRLPTELDRPLAEYLHVVVAPFTEMRGDRVEYDDRGVVTGIGRINDIPAALVVQDSRGSTNTTAAIRKIQRVARFAGRFELPLVMIVDGKEPELPYSVTPGESFAAAKLMTMMSVLPIPVVSVGAGKVQGTVAHLMMAGDRRMLAEHASYRIDGGTGGWNPTISTSRGREWGARECLRMGIIDQVIEMPEGGVVADPWMAVRLLQEDVHAALVDLGKLGPHKLVERRVQTNRDLGQTEEGIAAVLGELREWQDVQTSISKSIDDWRTRLDERMGALDQRVGASERMEKLESRIQLPSFQRPDLSELGARLKARQEQLMIDLRERTSRSDKDEIDEVDTE